MALIKKVSAPNAATAGRPTTTASTARDAEAQRKKARTLAKQQQAAERIAAANWHPASMRPLLQPKN